MLQALAGGLVVVGGAILIGALLPVRRLIRQLPEGSVRRRWHLLSALIKLVILGYLGYFASLWHHPMELHDLIVPVVFLLGACFVWLTTALSLQTAINIRRVSRLEQENLTDPLTGLHNRPYLERRLGEEFDRALRYNTPFSVLLIDIDHFKQLNDSHGHQVGDLALRHLSRLLLQSLRTSDLIARYGGEEFVVLAPNTDLGTAGGLAERLRQFVQNHGLAIGRDDRERRIVPMTVSIGVADSRRPLAAAGGLLALADQALSRAKAQGRNRVECAAPGEPADAKRPVCPHS